MLIIIWRNELAENMDNHFRTWINQFMQLVNRKGQDFADKFQQLPNMAKIGHRLGFGSGLLGSAWFHLFGLVRHCLSWLCPGWLDSGPVAVGRGRPRETRGGVGYNEFVSNKLGKQWDNKLVNKWKSYKRFGPKPLFRGQNMSGICILICWWSVSQHSRTLHFEVKILETYFCWICCMFDWLIAFWIIHELVDY